MRRVELFEQIRRDARAGSSVRSLAKKYRVHRRVIRQALASATPPERERPDRERPVLTREVRSFNDGILRADREAPRKQRHTATRIFQRIREELGVTVGASTVRHYVCERRRELGVGAVAFVPQHHPEGGQAEVDFYEAHVLMRGELVKVGALGGRGLGPAQGLPSADPGRAVRRDRPCPGVPRRGVPDRAVRQPAALPGVMNETEWKIGGQLVAFGRKPADYDPAAFQGIHARWVLVILDEACGVPEALWNAAETLTANEGSRNEVGIWAKRHQEPGLSFGGRHGPHRRPG